MHARFAIAAALAVNLAASVLARPADGPGAAGHEMGQDARQRQVRVGVVDDAGQPVSGLGVSDFSVREDGISREVLSVAQASDPMHVALLVDTSAAAEPVIPDLRKGLSSFVHLLLSKNPDSKIAVISFGDRPTQEADYSSSAAGLDGAIQRIFSRPSAGAYLIEGILDAVKGLKARASARPVIVSVVVEAGPEFSTQVPDDVRTALKSVGAELWNVVLQGPAPAAADTVEARNRALVLGDVTRESGGETDTILARTAIDAQLQTLANRLLAQYTITYSRPEALIPPERLDVGVTRKNLHVLAPHWTGK